MDIRKEAYSIITTVLSKQLFSDKLLEKMAKRLRAAGENADLLYFLVKGVIKMEKNLEYIAMQFTDKERFYKTDKKIKYLIYLGLFQLIYSDKIPDHAAVNETVVLAKKNFNNKVGNFVNAVLRSYLRNPKIEYPENTSVRLSLEYSFPKKIIERWLEKWGDEKTEELCLYFNDVPQLHIRVNNLKITKIELMKYFENKQIEFSESEISSNILLSNQARKVLNCEAFKDGLFSIQDTSAALVVELLDPQQNESILDLFAAPGGKSTYISELMNGHGEVVAIDKYPHKMKRMKQALKRLGISNIQLNSVDAFQFGPVAPAFDRVLLDVPCSGWGVFQKKAELRWQKNQDMKQLLKLQKQALKTGAEFVKPGGYLVYSTCTLNESENENMVQNFLDKNKNFTLISASNNISKEFTENGFLKTLPFKDDTDGAFAAKLQKNV